MKTVLLYLLLVGVPALAVLSLLHFGEPGDLTIRPSAGLGVVNQTDPPLHFPLHLAQVLIVLILARGVGTFFRFIRQPRVIGEMVAGILLGPSAFGWVAPRASAFLFPATSLGLLNSLSGIGLLLYMFLVGLRLDLERLTRYRHVFLLTSHTSIVFPFGLGVLLAIYLYPGLSGERATFAQFALFVGTAMSVTAFPVL